MKFVNFIAEVADFPKFVATFDVNQLKSECHDTFQFNESNKTAARPRGGSTALLSSHVCNAARQHGSGGLRHAQVGNEPFTRWQPPRDRFKVARQERGYSIVTRLQGVLASPVRCGATATQPCDRSAEATGPLRDDT
jgi:hypothetical protein